MHILADHVQDGDAQQHHQNHENHQDDEHGGDEHVNGFEQPTGSTFTHTVNAVESSTEGPGVPGGRPQRTQNTGQQNQTRTLTARELLDGVFQNAVHLSGGVVLQERENRGGAIFALAKNTEQGDDGE